MLPSSRRWLRASPLAEHIASLSAASADEFATIRSRILAVERVVASRPRRCHSSLETPASDKDKLSLKRRILQLVEVVRSPFGIGLAIYQKRFTEAAVLPMSMFAGVRKGITII